MKNYESLIFTSFVVRQSSEHLIKNMVIFFIGKWPDDPRLIEKVAVDLGSVQSTIGHLDLDEMALRNLGKVVTQ